MVETEYKKNGFLEKINSITEYEALVGTLIGVAFGILVGNALGTGSLLEIGIPPRSIEQKVRMPGNYFVLDRICFQNPIAQLGRDFAYFSKGMRR